MADRRPIVLPVRVYYEDTDAAGVVYYANYLKYCERGRTEWLRGMGFDQSRLLADRGLVFVVRSVQADYLKPALLDDQLEVVTRIDKLSRASVTFGQVIQRDGLILFDAQINVACVDWNERRPTPIPADIRQQFEAK